MILAAAAVVVLQRLTRLLLKTILMVMLSPPIRPVNHALVLNRLLPRVFFWGISGILVAGNEFAMVELVGKLRRRLTRMERSCSLYGVELFEVVLVKVSVCSVAHGGVLQDLT